MKNLFVPYEEAKQLKELGFDEDCRDWWGSKGIFNQKSDLGNIIGAPTWGQAFEYLLADCSIRHHCLEINDSEYILYKYYFDRNDEKIREEIANGKLNCLRKLIVLCQL